MCRVTMGHLRVTIGHLRVTVGHPRVTTGHLKATVVYFRKGNYRLFFSISKHKAKTTELHPKVWPTCFLFLLVNGNVFSQFFRTK